MLNETQTGQPVFGKPIKLAEISGGSSIAVADIDGDGKNEIAVSGNSRVGATVTVLSTTELRLSK